MYRLEHSNFQLIIQVVIHCLSLTLIRLPSSRTVFVRWQIVRTPHCCSSIYAILECTCCGECRLPSRYSVSDSLSPQYCDVHALRLGRDTLCQVGRKLSYFRIHLLAPFDAGIDMDECQEKMRQQGSPQIKNG